MELQVILMFLLTLLLVIVSAWSVGTFLRLQKASDKYKDDRVFEEACQVSSVYVQIGVIMGVIITLLALGILAMASIKMYKSF